ncbi:uncharacterized protein [Littorina saxatilis]|uniref:uncharacterized protein n=1 Tax=Littorina saxatilis TaxID=31220 RepID=UPI0038B580DD
MAAEERVLPLEPEHQRKFDTVLRATNQLVNENSLMAAANKNVTKLALKRVLPDHISLSCLMSKLENLQVLDLSANQLGPQGIRTLCLALPPSSSVASLSIADNKTDTDTAESIGRLLSEGPPLVYLDVSSNYLGKDFLSRSLGQALKTNTALHTLKAQSVGMVDGRVLLEGLKENTTLVELNLSSNQLSDRAALGTAMAAVLKRPECSLQSLALSGCAMNSESLKLLSDGLAANTSLQELNVNNNEFGTLQLLLEFVATVVSHPCLQNLHANDAKLTDTSVKGLPKPSTDRPSKLQVLSFNLSNVTDDFFSQLAAVFKGKLPSLLDVELSNNDKLTAAAVGSLWTLSADDKGQSSVHKLTVAMNEMNGLPKLLTPSKFHCLSYLSVRKARFSPDEFSALCALLSPSGLPLTTLVLDGMKLSGKKGLAVLFGNCTASKLSALSMSGCSLNDGDLSPLMTALGSGFKLHMLKLSDNRLMDATLKSLAENLQKAASHPLSVVDIAGNQITSTGAKDLCGVYSNKKHTSSLHSLNLANNGIGKEGLLCLVACMGGKSPLTCLYINNQTTSFLESDVEEIYTKIASVLGYTVKKTGETIQKGCSDLPSLPDGLTINMRGLGGHSGELGPFLDCPAIVTDSSSQRLLTLTLENVFDICGSLQGQKDGKCVLSSKDWNHITGADKNQSTPSWLQVAESRSKGVYLSNLPGNSTSQRLEALFDSEADCNIDEVFLEKDPVTKNNTGCAWVLFSDEASVDRAMTFYHSGAAQVFGTAFTVSRIKVTIEESGSSDASAKARQEVAARQQARAAEDRAHRQLIQQNAEETWKRHAYRLAHPAYADGRIW